MTEEEWLTSVDATNLMVHLQLRKRSLASVRKFRLCGCEFVLFVKSSLEDQRSLDAVEIAEQYADGLCGIKKMRAGARKAKAACDEASRRDLKVLPVEWAAHRLMYIPSSTGELRKYRKRVSEISIALRIAISQSGNKSFSDLNVLEFQSNVVRDIFGNPYRPFTLDTSWHTSTVRALAAGIYEERAFDRMPILADALEEAGCDKVGILNHCRQPGKHCRGCWVVDLVLGKP